MSTKKGPEMADEKQVSPYLKQELRSQNEARLIAIHNRLMEAEDQINMAYNTAEKETLINRLESADEYLRKARTLATELE